MLFSLLIFAFAKYRTMFGKIAKICYCQSEFDSNYFDPKCNCRTTEGLPRKRYVFALNKFFPFIRIVFKSELN